MKSGLFVLIPGFGSPHLEHKLQILKNNVAALNDLLALGVFERIALTICVYEPGFCLPELTEWMSPRTALQVIYEPGIVGQFMHRHADPEGLNILRMSHCLVLLDDVELTHSPTAPFPWLKMINDYDRLHLNLLSPTMTHDSKCLFPYLLQRNAVADRVAITSAAEMFCYYMDAATWSRYYAELSPEHPWLWGIDLVLTKHLGFRVGLAHYATFRHHYQTVPTDNADTRARFKAMEDYLATYGETQASLATQPAVLEDIYIYQRNPFKH